MRNRKPQYLGLSALVMSLMTVVAACGSSSHSASSGAATSSGPTPTGTPIKVGLAIAKSGFNAVQYGAAEATAQAWAASVNATGGLGGHPVQIVVADTAGTPATALKAANQLVDDDGVAALLISDSATEAALGPVLAKKTIPVIGSYGFAPTWQTTANFFPSDVLSPGSQQGDIPAAASIGVKNIFAVVCAEAPSCAQTGPPLSAQAKADGRVNYVGLATAAATDADFTSQCLAAIQAKAQGIILALTTDVAVRVERACIQQGYTGSFILGPGPWVLNQLDGVSGAKYAGLLGAFPWWVDAPPVNAFRAAMQKYAPKTDVRSVFATGMWSSLELFKIAVGKVQGDVTAASVLAAYGTIKDETVGGLLPYPVSYTAGQPTVVPKCFWLVNYTAGDKTPKVLHDGKNGNGASGDLASSCLTVDATKS